MNVPTSYSEEDFVRQCLCKRNAHLEKGGHSLVAWTSSYTKSALGPQQLQTLLLLGGAYLQQQRAPALA